jgi:hypothetical protein
MPLKPQQKALIISHCRAIDDHNKVVPDPLVIEPPNHLVDASIGHSDIIAKQMCVSW